MRRLASHKGQMLIIFALFIVPVSVGLGVVSTDVGLWLSERRGAQKDSDLAALAGARELLAQYGSNISNSTLQANASNAAISIASTNDEAKTASIADPNAPVVDNSCYGKSSNGQPILDAVTIHVRHEAHTFFGSFFGVGAPKVGAHAKACAGAVVSTTGIGVIPIEIDNQPGPCFGANGQPIYTSLCELKMGSQQGNPRGVLDLFNSGPNCSENNGSGNLTTLIANGSTAFCTINTGNPPACNPTINGPWKDCVAVQTGDPKKIVNGFQQRLARETGDGCDLNNNGYDDFSEAVKLVSGPPTTGLYEPVICPTSGKPSPRLITIFVLTQDPPPGNTGWPIVGFADFYVSGCGFDNQPPPQSQADLDVHCSQNNQFGHVTVWGNFVKLILTGGDIGPPNPNSTGFGISLVQ